MFDVITIGTATKDVFTHVPDESRCFEPGSKVETLAPVFASGGGAVNAAVTFARQGLKTAALFRVGADRHGDDVIEELRAEGLESWESRDKKISTGYGNIFVFPNGERTSFVHRGATDALSAKDIPFNKLKARWAYIAPSHIDLDVMEKIIEHCYYQGILIAFNPSKFYLEQRGRLLNGLLNKIKVLLVNREEAAYLTGASRDNEREIFARLDKLVDGIAVMTDGPRGAWVSDGRCVYHSGIFKNETVADRTGAGDAFGSGFVAGLLMKEDIEYAIRLAGANATSVVEKIGAHNGALTRRQFENDRRWKKLEIQYESNIVSR